MEKVKIGKYKHFKGKYYEVIGIARNSENHEEEFVVYKALYESDEFGKGELWIRPKNMFFEKVIYNGKEVSRFEFVEDE